MIGVLILVYLAIIYKGGTIEEPIWMRPHWWGILGLIGWAYLMISTLYLIVGNRLTWLVVLFAAFLFLNIQQEIEIIPGLPKIKIIVVASNYVLVISGLIASLLYIKFNEKGKIREFLVVMGVLALVFITFAIMTRPEWGIKKIGGTPSWSAICAGIGFASFGILYILADIMKVRKWAAILGPAGTATLTCYLVPYFYYGFYSIIGYSLPLGLRTGYVGIVKSLLFALLIVLITGGLEKLKIKLKI